MAFLPATTGTEGRAIPPRKTDEMTTTRGRSGAGAHRPRGGPGFVARCRHFRGPGREFAAKTCGGRAPGLLKSPRVMQRIVPARAVAGRESDCERGHAG